MALFSSLYVTFALPMGCARTHKILVCCLLLVLPAPLASFRLYFMPRKLILGNWMIEIGYLT